MTHTWPVYGHDWAVEHLIKGMANGRVRHAYLIAGIASIGKNTLAHAFAMALNCTADDPAARPCGICRSCRLVISGNHPDLLYSETDPNTGALKIEAIRGVTQRIALKPYETRYRVAILQDFDHAQPRAQDALLKTLEEPPPHAILILLVNSLESILPTITSRAQTIHLRPVSAQAVQEILVTRYEVDPDHALLLARLSGGRIGWAIQAAQYPEMLDQRAQALDMLEDCLGMNRAARFGLAEGLSKDKPSLALLLELWQTYWRDALLLAEGSPVKPCNVDRQVALEQLAYSVTPEQALEAMRATRTMLGYLPLNVNTRLALETMFLDYPGLSR